MSFTIHDIFKAILGPVGNELADVVQTEYAANKEEWLKEAEAAGATLAPAVAARIEAVADPLIDKSFHGFGFVVKGFVHTTISRLVNEGTVALNSGSVETDLDKIVANLVAGLRTL